MSCSSRRSRPGARREGGQAVTSDVGSEPAIWTQGLSKRYGNVAALLDLDLEVAAGEVVGYLGPNGAGKTTTIRLLSV